MIMKGYGTSLTFREEAQPALDAPASDLFGPS